MTKSCGRRQQTGLEGPNITLGLRAGLDWSLEASDPGLHLHKGIQDVSQESTHSIGDEADSQQAFPASDLPAGDDGPVVVPWDAASKRYVLDATRTR